MTDNNRAIVKIYGQQYTIAGTSSSEDMERVAGYVDDLMYKLAKNQPALSTLSLAVLTAVNVANEYFETLKLNQSQQDQIDKMKEDAERYSALWEDAKASLLKYQDETKNGVEQLQELQRIFNMKNEELEQVKEALKIMTARCEEAENQLREAPANEAAPQQSTSGTPDQPVKQTEECEALQKKVEDLEAQLKKVRKNEKNESRTLADFRDKYKELENSFFDIQMENITLKNELDELRKKQ